MKQDEDGYRKKVKATGGGPPPERPDMTEEYALASSMMGAELNMGKDAYDTFRHQVHPIDEDFNELQDVTIGE